MIISLEITLQLFRQKIYKMKKLIWKNQIQPWISFVIFVWKMKDLKELVFILQIQDIRLKKPYLLK